MALIMVNNHRGGLGILIANEKTREEKIKKRKKRNMATVNFSTECPAGYGLNAPYIGTQWDVPAKLYFLCSNFPENVVFQNEGGIIALFTMWFNVNIPGLINTEDNAIYDPDLDQWLGQTPVGITKYGGGSDTLFVVFCSRVPTQNEIDQIVTRLETVQPI